MEYKGLTESTKRDEVPSSGGLGNRGVVIFLLSFKNCDLPIQEPVRGPRPADGAGTGAPAKPSNARDQARAARGEAKLSPRPVAEDAAARAMTALKEKGNDGSVVPEVS